MLDPRSMHDNLQLTTTLLIIAGVIAISTLLAIAAPYVLP